VIFAWSALPMLAKAYQTGDLASYSLGNLVLANVGNAVHSVHVFSLPVGPIWAAPRGTRLSARLDGTGVDRSA
jgi:hypothetical protein